MNTEKNSYTIIYAAVMVIVAAVLLALAATGLKETQNANEKIDKMQQILRTIGQTPEVADVVATYKKFVMKELLVNQKGEVLASFEGDELAESEAFKFDTEKAMKQKDYSKLPVFVVAVEEGKYAYVLPLNGNGLWDKIWGYISIDANDHSTVIGADFGNKGETPGLGAEISTPAFASQFKDKQIYQNGTFTSIAVVKHGGKTSEKDYVDGISGGTLTSNGVNDMLMSSISPYQKFLETYGTIHYGTLE